MGEVRIGTCGVVKAPTSTYLHSTFTAHTAEMNSKMPFSTSSPCPCRAEKGKALFGI